MQAYWRREPRIVISLVAMLASPGFAIAAIDASPWADSDSIIVKVRQTGCQHIGGDAIAAGISVDLTHALGDSRSLSARLDEPTTFALRQNELKILVWLRCLPGEKAKLEASVQHTAVGALLETFSVDGTIDDLLALRKELQKNLYQLLSMTAEPHVNQVTDATAYRNYLRAIGGTANGDDWSKINELKTAIKSSDMFGPL